MGFTAPFCMNRCANSTPSDNRRVAVTAPFADGKDAHVPRAVSATMMTEKPQAAEK